MRRIVFLALLSFIGSNLFAASITGIVKEKSEKAIVSATVSVYQSGKIVATAKTDVNGEYFIKELKAGNYSLLAEMKGYSSSLPQTVILTDRSEKTINFVLVQSVEIIIEELNIVEDDVDEVVLDCEVVSKNESSARNRKLNENRGNIRSLGCVSNSNINMSFDCDASYIQHNTEDYDYIKENAFRNPKDEPLSTFSVDVDRASYANVRRYINQNQMPPVDAVRIEEMINYFDYKYSQPTDGHPFATHLEYGDCAWNEKHKLLLIGLQGETIDNEDVPASNIVFLLDVSGSMNSPNKLPLLKKSFNILLEKLRPEDRVAIVVYAGNAGCVLESTSGTEKEKISAALDRLQAGGSTAGGAGIKLAYKIAKENFIKDGNNRVILATDGDFNIGASSDSELERMIEAKRDDGIFLTVLGFGMGNYKDNKMEKLSNKGNGNYAYIDNILEAKKMFSEELWGTLYTIAKDVKIQIEFNPNVVSAYRLVGYENRLLNKEDFNDDKKDAGEIGAGHVVTAIYEIVPIGSDEKFGDVDDLIYQSRNLNRMNDLMTLKLRYKAPDENTSRLLTQSIKAKSISSSELSENFELASAVAMFGMILRNSEFKGTSSYDKVLNMAKSAKGEDKNGYRNEFISLVEKAKLMN